MLIIQLKWKQILPVLILVVMLTGSLSLAEVRTESDTFPLCPSIQPNVNFWLKIYTQYSSDQGVIHDKRQMGRIYGVIPLVDPYRAGGRKINNKRIKAVKKKYKAILSKLMQGKPPAGAEEQRVAKQFGPESNAAVFRSAMRNLRCQTGQKDRFRKGLIRSGAYIDEIKQIFRDVGLPEDLAYLPHVESSFNPKAYSKFGASGMWQFTRATGKRFMKVGYTIDERRDPILSSHAATKLLQQNYSKLNTWPMAITAYNHGVTGMRRAQRKKGSYERIFKEYRSRIFKFASRNFYSEFLAAREAAKNYRQYFGALELNRPRKTHAIELSGYVSLPEVARHLDLDLAEMRALNPALRDPIFREQKYVPRGYQLQLPDRYDRDWNQLIAQLPRELYRHNQKRSSIYTVRRGDTAGKIAKKHGVKLNDLIAVNNLDRRATIYVNQNLRIPLPEDKSVRLAKNTKAKKKPAASAQTDIADKPAMRASAANIDLTTAVDRNPPAQKGKTAGTNSATATPIHRPLTNQMAEFLLAQGAVAEYQPQESTSAFNTGSTGRKANLLEPETVPLLADLTGDSINAVVRESSRQIQSDSELMTKDNEIALIPAQPQFIALKPTEAGDKPSIKPNIMQGHFAVDRVSMQGGKSIGHIRVEAEETLGHYAEWLNVPASEIRRLNGFRYGQPLHLSQKIKIPLGRVSKNDFEVKRFEYHQELAEDFFASYRIEKVWTYSIKRGDNIWTLSHQEFEVPVWLIKHYNGNVDFGALVPSQKLLIPVVEKDA
ncbi:MAG: transglycosylase SLT domain-containing protein [bacterium]|nr:transglycosylase SLT domain-containing protein [bacterium]